MHLLIVYKRNPINSSNVKELKKKPELEVVPSYISEWETLKEWITFSMGEGMGK